MRPMAMLLASTVFAVSAGNAQALTSTPLPDYDPIFPGLCAGGTMNNFACEQAVPEARNGDNGTGSQQVEWNIGPNTGAPTDSVNIVSNTLGGFWTGTARKFTLTYDADGGTAMTGLLTFSVDPMGGNIGGTGTDEIVSYAVDLAPTKSMYIRAAARPGQTTSLTAMTLHGFTVPDLVGNDSADYLLLTDFDWDMDWMLMGNLTMSGNSTGSGARPSVQFKLTNLMPVPVPATLALVGFGLLALGGARTRRAR